MTKENQQEEKQEAEQEENKNKKNLVSPLLDEKEKRRKIEAFFFQLTFSDIEFEESSTA